MSERTMTTSEAADALGMPVGTLKTWLERLPIPVDLDSRGRRRLTPSALEAIGIVKSLRESDAGYETIRRRLEPIHESAPADAEPDQPSAADQPGVIPAEREPIPGSALPDVRELAGLLAAAVADVVKAENEQAEKYARATYEIGELRATTRGLEAERDRLAGELAEVKAERDQARALLAAPEPRPWWKLWG